MGYIGRIYVVTNVVNGKQYVGQTIQPVQDRWYQHLADAHRGTGCRLLAAAIRKYGSHAFTITNLQTVEAASPDERERRLDAAEVEAIRVHESLAPGGYNVEPGGRGKGRGISSETVLRMSLGRHEAHMRRRRAELAASHPTPVGPPVEPVPKQPRKLSPAHIEKQAVATSRSWLRKRMIARWPELAPFLSTGATLVGFEEHLPFLRPRRRRRRRSGVDSEVVRCSGQL